MIDKVVCPHCHGSGVVSVMGNFPLFKAWVQKTCMGCNGRGYVIVAAKQK